LLIGPNHLLVATVAVTAVAAGYDLKTGHIPNWITLGPMALGPVAWFAMGAAEGGFRVGLESAGFSILGALACALMPLILYQAGAMGGGDVKLLVAVGALCRALIGVEMEFYAFIAAALFAPARLAWEGKLFKTLGNTLVLVSNPFLPKAKRREIPKETMTWLRFAPAIFAGALVAAILHWRVR